MGTFTGWIAILSLAAGTFLLRYSFLGLLQGRKLHPMLARAVQLSVPAILAALVLPLILGAASTAPLATRLPHILAALAAAAWACWRGGLIVPMLIGFAVLHGVRAIG